MTPPIDPAALRAWLADVNDDDVHMVAAALSTLLAVYSAACAWRDAEDTLERTDVDRTWRYLDQMRAAIDAARGDLCRNCFQRLPLNPDGRCGTCVE